MIFRFFFSISVQTTFNFPIPSSFVCLTVVRYLLKSAWRYCCSTYSACDWFHFRYIIAIPISSYLTLKFVVGHLVLPADIEDSAIGSCWYEHFIPVVNTGKMTKMLNCQDRDESETLHFSQAPKTEASPRHSSLVYELESCFWRSIVLQRHH